MSRTQTPVTRLSSKDPRITFKIPFFKKEVLKAKNSQQSKPTKYSFESGRITWILVVGAKQKLVGSVVDDVCYAQLRISSYSPAFMKPFPVTYFFGLLGASGTVDAKTDPYKVMSSELITMSGTQVEIISKSMLMANKTRLVKNEAVTIVCQIHLDGSDDRTEKPSLMTYMSKLFCDGILTDIEIILAGGEVIRAHKNVLARSPVFLAMFSNEMMENRSGQVHAQNISGPVMKAMLNYLYTDRVDNMEAIAGELMVAADFYDLPNLKETCLQSLENNVNFSNFAFSLQIAERFDIASLREAVLRFIITNRSSVSKSSEWEELKANRDLYDIAVSALLNSSSI